MTFGPELPPQERARREKIVNRAGLAIYVGLAVLILFGALVAPLLL
ncbi:hypothetical protein IHQ68_17230 [Chelatococcus sambhunathii]|uniref:Uncharacterized protein n=1 Tax=Chelatococcus sambhunathii TaxID=363953 RepID=A0ABU1DJU2_9HYPH|nr:hypothetical protein [Chelatococcus sambhunathii]MDR4308364.1 hypothetical protein [Chelatococcus sambhunathii]